MHRPIATVICVSPFYFPSQKDCQQNLLHWSPSTHSVLVGTGTCTVSARRRVEKEVVRHLKKVILLWAYKTVNMKYSRQGGTKVLSLVDVILSSNEPMPSASSLLL
jgi:hypothetical protein